MKRAADFLAGYIDPDTGLKAPYSPQERWENQSGYSPNSIAAQIDGLVCAAAIARAQRRHRVVERSGCALADEWQSKVEGWTVTTNGPLSAKPYFLRLTKDGHPNTGTTYSIGDGGPSARTSAASWTRASWTSCASASRRPTTRPSLSTLPVVDKELEGEHAERAVLAPLHLRRVRRDAHRRRVADHRPGHRHDARPGWPLLTGERGEYAVTAGRSGPPTSGRWPGRPARGTCSPSRSGTAGPRAAGRAAPPGRAPARRRR